MEEVLLVYYYLIKTSAVEADTMVDNSQYFSLVLSYILQKHILLSNFSAFMYKKFQNMSQKRGHLVLHANSLRGRYFCTFKIVSFQLCYEQPCIQNALHSSNILFTFVILVISPKQNKEIIICYPTDVPFQQSKCKPGTRFPPTLSWSFSVR